MLRKSITRLLAVCAALCLLAPQTLLTHAEPLEKPASHSEKRSSAAILMPDAVSLFNQLTASTTPDGFALNVAVEPVQDDQTPPRISFSPGSLFLITTFFTRRASGTIISVALDQELPYIVAFGSSLAFAGGPCQVVDLFSFFDYVLIPDTAEIGIGWVSFAEFEGFYNPFSVYPCGGLEVVAVDFAGNVADSIAPVIVFSF